MYQRDYILRLIELFAKIVAHVLQLKEKKEYQQALAAIGEAYRSLLGIPSHIVHSMSDVQLIEFLKSTEKCSIMAGLLKEEAAILAEQGNMHESVSIYCKSLSLFLEAQHQEDVDAIVAALKEYELPLRLKRKLFLYYEKTGRYGDAENLLFDLADVPDSTVYELGMSFYDRLKGKSVEELQRGNLSKEEIVEGLTAFQRKFEQNEL